LPAPNEFIPTDFQLFSKEKNLTRPQLPTKIKVKKRHSIYFYLKLFLLFKENEFYRIFYAEDSFYKLPKAYIYFEFRKYDDFNFCFITKCFLVQ
jgi:secreted Zn-dependent insulinase-like peptidase